MRAILALAIAVGLAGCAAEQKTLSSYNGALAQRTSDTDIYDRVADRRVAVRMTNLLATLNTDPSAYRTAAAAYLQRRGCTVQEAFPIDAGTWEFTYQCA